jgi:hypothetical protein
MEWETHPYPSEEGMSAIAPKAFGACRQTPLSKTDIFCWTRRSGAGMMATVG